MNLSRQERVSIQSALTETSFLPGRRFNSPADFNSQLADWLARANTGLVRRIGARPSERIGIDQAAMLTLPPVAPVTGIQTRVRLPRDYYVRIDTNDYSVHPEAIGRLVDVSADLTHVRVTLAGRIVGSHARCWAARRTITDPTHQQAAARLREDYRISATHPPAVHHVALRALPDYTTCSAPASLNRQRHYRDQCRARPGPTLIPTSRS